MKKLLMLLSLMFVATVSYADTETVTWYKEGAVYDTTTCQTGDYIDFPTQPTKRGYNFVGWEVALYDFSTLDASINGTKYTQNASNQTWSVTFPYGTLHGKSLCSTTIGSYTVTGTPDELGTGETQYCWCKATGYKPAGSSIVYENSSSSSWVFVDDNGSASRCTSLCANFCGSYFLDRANFRQALFGVTQ